MTRHPPKLFALEAKLEGLLSERGEAYLDRHLTVCATCQAALQAMREYRGLRDAARNVSVPELSWERFEAKLEQESKAGPRSAPKSNGKLIALALPVLTIAATLVIGYVGISGQRELAQRTAVPKASTAQAPAPEDVKLTGWVTAARTARLNEGVVEGATLRTAEDEELHVHLADDTGIVLWPESELTVSRLRAHEIRLTLVRGGVSNAVRKLAASDTYMVEANGISAEVRGTHFFVGLDARGVSVDVHEGKVAIVEQGKQVDLLLMGQSYSRDADRKTASPDRQVSGLDATSQAFPVLRLPSLPQVSAWHLGEARWSATAELAIRMPAGRLEMSFEDARGALHPFEITLASEGSIIEEGLIRATLQAEADARMGTLEPEQISPVIKQGLPSLKRCYEQSLRREPKLEGRLTLAVRVAADGHVARADLRGEAGLPADLSRCIANQARLWMFPAPVGGPVAFEVPLNLKSSSAP